MNIYKKNDEFIQEEGDLMQERFTLRREKYIFYKFHFFACISFQNSLKVFFFTSYLFHLSIPFGSISFSFFIAFS